MHDTSMSSRAANDIQVASNEDQLKEENSLRKQVIDRFFTVRRACVRDLMNELNPGADARALKAVVDHLLQEGLIRPIEKDENDPRQYTGERTVYELVK
jgi:hypothetical protein